MENGNVQNEKKQGKGILIALVCTIIIILGLILYICYDKGIIFASDNQANTTEKKTNNKKIENNKVTETLFSINNGEEFYLKNYSNSTKILNYSNNDDGFLNSISTLDLENSDLFYVESKWQVIDDNAKNHKYTIKKIKSNEYNNQQEKIYESVGSVSNLYVKNGILYFVEQISTLNGDTFDETTNLKSYNLKNKSEKTLKTLATVNNSGSFIVGMYLDKKEDIIYYSTSDNKLYSMSLDGSNEKNIANDCSRMNSNGGLLVYTTPDSENYLLYNSSFKKVNSSDVWLYKKGYIYSSENGIIYYDGKEEQSIFTDAKTYSIKYVDGKNNIMLIVDTEDYGEGSDYKKIDLIDYNVNNADSSIEQFIKTIEYN